MAFGALAVPITTLATVSDIPEHHLAQIVGRKTPVLGLFVPMTLVFIIDTGRGVRATLPATLTCGIAFAVAQFATSNFLSTQLPDFVASLVGAASVVLLLRVWQPNETFIEAPEEEHALASSAARGDRGVAGEAPAREGIPMAAAGGSDHPIGHGAGTVEELTARDRGHHSTADVVRAYAPYLIIIAIFSITQIPIIRDAFAAPSKAFQWPGCIY